MWKVNQPGFTVGVLFQALISLSCGNGNEGNSNSTSFSGTGNLLAEKYCSGCHLVPSPDLLDKKTWSEHALPSMGYRLGIFDMRNRDSLIEDGFAGRMVRQAGIFPEPAVLTQDEWELIQKYYTTHAPEELHFDSAGKFKGEMPFRAVSPVIRFPRPAISAILYDANEKTLYVSDCSREKGSSVIVLDHTLRPVTTLGLPYPVSNIAIRSDTLYILMMGHFVPSDEPAGQLIRAIKNKGGSYEGYQMVVKGLKRPVDIAYEDLDGDGDEDFVIAEFGNHLGSVTHFVNNGGNSYERKVLFNSPGAVDVIVEDMNADGRLDILVLMAQGDEGIDLYINKGGNAFDRSRLIRFPPVYGSVSMSLCDFNRDGFKDITYVNGDNADASQVFKPYHGIRLLMNDGRMGFKESFFHPLPGAYQAVMADFDSDGDDDIAAISFFPDFKNYPEKGFVYLENISRETGEPAFAEATLPETQMGRWMIMEEGDFNNDKRLDLILGSFTSMAISGDSTNEIRQKHWTNEMPLLLLENNADGKPTGEP